jgi:hypothetical protein
MCNIFGNDMTELISIEDKASINVRSLQTELSTYVERYIVARLWMEYFRRLDKHGNFVSQFIRYQLTNFLTSAINFRQQIVKEPSFAFVYE